MQIAREEAHLRDLEGGEPEKSAEPDKSVATEPEHGDGKVTEINKKIASA